MSKLFTPEEYVDWANRVAGAYEKLTENQELSLQAWRAAGESFSSWPGWAIIVGRPGELKMKPVSEILKAERTG
jgi:hypothetical protein